MTIHFFTICLDGMPWLPLIWGELRKLQFPWTWHVMEGVAANVHDTRWCNSIPERLSNDGTTQFLAAVQFDRRVRVYQKKLWDGKIEMVNAPLKSIKEPCLLWEIDADEIWTATQIERMRSMFIREPKRTTAQFYCRYFFGPEIFACDAGKFGNRAYDWLRVWRFKPGMRFAKHEPPTLVNANGTPFKDVRFTQKETSDVGLVFDHHAYSLRKTVAFKQQYYRGEKNAYQNAVAEWEYLQKCTKFPVQINKYLSWVDDDALGYKL